MRIPNVRLLLLFSFVLSITAFAQTKAAPQPIKGPAPVAAKGAVVAKAPTGPPATLAQLMKGIFYPNSNVIFAAQNTNPADVPQAKDPSVAVNPLESAYGKWEAVENSGLALADAASLLTMPGRKCSNGRAVPMQNADWAKLVGDLRKAGLVAYQAAKAKDQDKILDAADVMTTACSNCHEKYREPKVRCK
ncbi:MAG: hypothetical protein ABI824_16330 [Acidobacteriota bacterium]